MQMWAEVLSLLLWLKLFCVVCFSDELTRLWNLNQDNMEACKSDSRWAARKPRQRSSTVTFACVIRINHVFHNLMFSESSCHRWMSSSPRLLNRPTLLTWWRKSISKFAASFWKLFGKDSRRRPQLSSVNVNPLLPPVNIYRVVRNPNYGWRALRLLSRRSPHFFQPTNQKFKSLADYLDSMVSKLAKELPVRNKRKVHHCRGKKNVHINCWPTLMSHFFF